MLWKLAFLPSPFIYVLTDVSVIISSVVSTIYLECHWNGDPPVEDMTLEKENMRQRERARWMAELVMSASI